MVKVLLLKTDGTCTQTQFNNHRELQKLTEGYSESVSPSPNVTLYVNEEGLLRSLPLNRYNKILSYLTGTRLCLHGPIVICGPVDEDGNDTDVEVKATQLFAKPLATLELLIK